VPVLLSIASADDSIVAGNGTYARDIPERRFLHPPRERDFQRQ
jgi:hypothetical protein